jgi:DNA-3-methyladenine glycosylase II
MSVNTYNKATFRKHCDNLRAKHLSIEKIHAQYGYPPYWKRPLTFETVLKTILEQQVSLTSARAVYARVASKLRTIDAVSVLNMGAAGLGACGVTRQKQLYIRTFAALLQAQPQFLRTLRQQSDSDAYNTLLTIKGVGPWTASVLMLVMLNRIDVYPEGDVALVNGIVLATHRASRPHKDEAHEFIKQYAPLRSIAVCYYYWVYIKEKGVVFTP